MLMFAYSGHGRRRWHLVSRVIIFPLGGQGGLTSTVSWQLWSKRSERNN